MNIPTKKKYNLYAHCMFCYVCYFCILSRCHTTVADAVDAMVTKSFLF